MKSIAPQIEEDRQTLIALMARTDSSRNLVARAKHQHELLEHQRLLAGARALGSATRLETR